MVPNNFPTQSTVPISAPITYPDDELADLGGGFVWTDTQGIVMKTNANIGQSATSFLK